MMDEGPTEARDEEVDDLYARLDRLQSENERLRATLSNVEEICVYPTQAWEETVSEILAAIRERAGIETQTKDGK